MGGRGEPELRPLNGCGAELRLPAGRLVDALQPTEAAAVRAALRRYPALLIRRQQALGVGGLDAFTRGVLRGPVYDPSEHGALLPDPARSRAYLVTNVDPATGAARDGALSGDAVKGSAGNHEWHSDYCWKAEMNPVTMLLCRRFACAAGGQTELADARAAYAALPVAARAKVAGLATAHGGVNFPAVRQPLVKRSPLSGAPALLVGAHAKGVEGRA